MAKSNLILADKTKETRTASELRSEIETAQNSNSLVTFVDVDGTEYTCLFHEIDQSSWVIDPADTSEDQIAITLIEA